MLLTSSQLSMGISSVVVFAFTSLLFLAGYVLQQQTVRSLQLALHPPIEPAPDPSDANTTSSYVSWSGQRPLRADPKSPGLPGRGFAYVQIVRQHREVCNALMAFARLARDGSPVSRLLLYPSQWHQDLIRSKARDRHLDIAMRLARRASDSFGVRRIPMTAMHTSNTDLETTYPTQILLSLQEYDRLALLRPRGLVLNSESLDNLFELPLSRDVTPLARRENERPSVVMIKPSSTAWEAFMNRKAAADAIWAHPMPLNDEHQRVGSTEGLGLVAPEDSSFNETDFRQSMAYMHFSDPQIPGPEYDIPNAHFDYARPPVAPQNQIWDELYELYRNQRMDECGLDVEPLPGS